MKLTEQRLQQQGRGNMNKIPKKINGNIYFRNFVVQKESGNFYGVYESFMNEKFGELITSGTSMNNAVKKAKLLQKGYDIRKDL